MTSADTSVIIPACAPWHPAHQVAREALDGGLRLIAHCAVETYSVLTRMPPDQRVDPAKVQVLLEDFFPEEPLMLSAARMHTLVAELVQRGVSGGAVYDGLIALTAAEFGAELVTLDQRAERTYRQCGVNYRMLA